MQNCIFCKIIEGKIPSTKVYEDDDIIIIKDIAPQAKIHLVLIPKEHYANILEMTESQSLILGRSFKKLSTIVNDLGLSDGFRIVSNKGYNGCQSVDHLHIHILGGEKLTEKFGH
ncbi:MAG: HIT domain-containing protein [Christensenellaceae bacterium]|jgi:histidine triad (HIT) family protein|nr:HIT domain-containing protein [Christensenellaceae bacterium]